MSCLSLELFDSHFLTVPIQPDHPTERKRPIVSLEPTKTLMVPRDQVIDDLSNRFYGMFCLSKRRDFQYIAQIVDHCLPHDFAISMKEYLLVGVSVTLQNIMYDIIKEKYTNAELRMKPKLYKSQAPLNKLV